GQFRAKLLQQGFVDGRGLFALRPDIQGSADHLGERNEILERALDRRGRLFRTIRQALDSVQHSYGQLAAADRTAPVSLQGLRRLPAYLALAVAVVMVLAFLRIELQGAREARGIPRFKRLVNGGIRQLGVKAGTLA